MAAGGRLVGDEPLRYVGHPPHPSGFRPRIGVRGMLLIAGVTSWESVFIAIADAGCCRHAKV